MYSHDFIFHGARFFPSLWYSLWHLNIANIFWLLIFLPLAWIIPHSFSEWRQTTTKMQRRKIQRKNVCEWRFGKWFYGHWRYCLYVDSTSEEQRLLYIITFDIEKRVSVTILPIHLSPSHSHHYPSMTHHSVAHTIVMAAERAIHRRLKVYAHTHFICHYCALCIVFV